MPIKWARIPCHPGYCAKLSNGLTLSVHKVYDATSRGPEQWLIHSLTHADIVALSGLEAAIAKAEELARQELVDALDALGPVKPVRAAS